VTLSLGVALLLSACLLLGFADGPETVDAREYSAYADPEKPVISVILSDEGNVEDFQSEFGLSSEEMENVLAAVRRENRTLVREFSESELIVESNAGLRDEQIRGKIAASDYDERLRAAVTQTKSTIENLLPESRRSELEAWVNAKFAQAEQHLSGGTASARRFGATRGRGVSCKVFATQYNGYTRYEVALPHRRLKERGGFRISIRRGEHRARAPVKEVGPWNMRDDYWQSRRHRDMWRNLPRCTPEAQAAYFRNYHRGRDQFGRKVLNPAGVDLTPRVAYRLGLKRYQNAWVYLRYPRVRDR
jgi:hypothetical protein